MFARPLILLAVLGLVGVVAIVQTPKAPDPYSPAALTGLLRQPPSRSADGQPAPHATLGSTLLNPPFATPDESGRRLELGRVWSAPTVARLAAERAGELLDLEAEGPDGPTGKPLWRVLVDGPSTQPGEPATLALYGCRHSADSDAAPAIEDTYAARQSLARALEQHARSAGLSLDLRGTDAPVKGGVNFEVQLSGERHALVATFDGHPGKAYRAWRTFRPTAPFDDAVRASLVRALRDFAAEDPAHAGLELEGIESPVAGGVDLRIELLDGRLQLTAQRGLARAHGQASPAPELTARMAADAAVRDREDQRRPWTGRRGLAGSETLQLPPVAPLQPRAGELVGLGTPAQ
jgi:hypothetical protein